MSTDFLNKYQSGSVSEEKNTDKDWNSDGDDEEIDMYNTLFNWEGK